jgi:hypothetical protein
LLIGFATDTDVEIGINTYDLFQRGKGYAWLAARAFLDDCLKQGRTPHWKTEDFRIPSIKLAGKVDSQIFKPIQLMCFLITN